MRARVLSDMSVRLVSLPTTSPSSRSRGLRRVVLGAGLAIAGAGLSAGCASKKPTPPPPQPAAVSVPTPPARPMPANEIELLNEIKKTGLEAEEVEKGLLIYLPTLYLFEFDRAELDPDTRRRIAEVAKLLDSPPARDRRLIVEGHTDAVGSRAYNQKLSERRAQAVIDELITAGVGKARITMHAYGKDKPLVPNRNADGTDNPEGRAKNRRVALLIENPAPPAAATAKP